jgi:hypothetical protein
MTDFIENYTMNMGELVVVRNLYFKDTVSAHKSFNESFEAFLHGKNDSIKITENEKQYILRNYLKYYSKKWLESDFPNYKLVNYEESVDYMKQNRKNSVLAISHPIFFRNETVALVSYANVCFSLVNNVAGETGLGLFRKRNGKWEKWEMINQGGY